MLAKSIIAGTVLSLMAGGVVYFGTDLDTAAAVSYTHLTLPTIYSV